MKTRQLDAMPYPSQVHLLTEVGVTDSPVAYARTVVAGELTERDVRELSLPADEDARTVALDGRPYIFVLVAPPDDGDQKELLVTLVHEFVHVVSFLYLYTGAKLSAKNDEPQAYMMSHLLRQALEEGGEE